MHVGFYAQKGYHETFFWTSTCLTSRTTQLKAPSVYKVFARMLYHAVDVNENIKSHFRLLKNTSSFSVKWCPLYGFWSHNIHLDELIVSLGYIRFNHADFLSTCSWFEEKTGVCFPSWKLSYKQVRVVKAYYFYYKTNEGCWRKMSTFFWQSTSLQNLHDLFSFLVCYKLIEN